MTTRELTRLRAIAPAKTRSIQPLSERLFRIAFGAVQWPWLLRSLHGGSKASKRALLRRLDLPNDALPHLGSVPRVLILSGSYKINSLVV